MTVACTPHRKAETFDDVVAERLSRRRLLKGTLGVSLASFLGGVVQRAAAGGPLLGFTGIPISRADTVSLPPGYTWQVVNAWGDFWAELRRRRSVSSRPCQYGRARRGTGFPRASHGRNICC